MSLLSLEVFQPKAVGEAFEALDEKDSHIVSKDLC